MLLDIGFLCSLFILELKTQLYITYLEEEERNFSLTAKLNEVRPLHGRLREEDPVVADDAHGYAVQTRESGYLKN